MLDFIQHDPVPGSHVRTLNSIFFNYNAFNGSLLMHSGSFLDIAKMHSTLHLVLCGCQFHLSLCFNHHHFFFQKETVNTRMLESVSKPFKKLKITASMLALLLLRIYTFQDLA